MSRTASAVETAKSVRKALKKHFPGTKFSVRSGYECVRVTWTDGMVTGASSNAVKAVCSEFDTCVAHDVYGDPYYSGVSVYYTHNVSHEIVEQATKMVEDSWTDAYEPNGRLNHWAEQELDDLCRNGLATEIESDDAQYDKRNYYGQPHPVVEIPIDEPIEHVSITPQHVEELAEDYRITAKLDCNKTDSIEDKNRSTFAETCKVTHHVVISLADYQALRHSLFDGQEWLEGKGGSGSDADLPEVKSFHYYTEDQQTLWIEQSYVLAVLVTAPGHDKALVIDPQGYNYARYAGEIDRPQDIPNDHTTDTNVVPFPSQSQPVESTPKTINGALKPRYEQWVQRKIAKQELDKIISFEDWVTEYGQAFLHDDYQQFVIRCIQQQTLHQIVSFEEWQGMESAS